MNTKKIKTRKRLFIVEYPFAQEAIKTLNIASFKFINTTYNDPRKLIYGYLWKYKDKK